MALLANPEIHAELPKDKPVITYCRGPFCLMSVGAVKLLRSMGFEALQRSARDCS
jgi:rhodanese-related sulfurtransferase